MVGVAIYLADPALRPRLEQLLRAELGYRVAGVTHDPATVSRLIEQSRVDTWWRMRRRANSSLSGEIAIQRRHSSSSPARVKGPGLRVPMVIVSPFAKKRFVDHTVYDMTIG